MPIPKPKMGKDPESQSDYMGRCMGGSTMMSDYPRQDQRVAVCLSTWRDAHPGSAPPPKKAMEDCPSPEPGESQSHYMDRCMANGGAQDDCMQMFTDYNAGNKAASTVRLNGSAESKAAGLISSGKVNTGAWSFDASDGSSLLGGENGDNWSNYAAYHLGEDTAEAPKTRARYKYPWGKGGEVYVAALRAIRSRASQQGATAVFDAAGRLLDKATKKQNGIPEVVERSVEMKWMPTVLEVKGLNDGERVLSGIATTPSVDLVGDIVVSTGAKYKLPLPLLLHHDHRLPVGTVTLAEPNEKGIPFTAKIARVQEDGVLKNRTDEAWQSLREGIIKGVSIGFTPVTDQYERMKSGGIKFNQWWWHELSLVVVPANQDASVTVIRALDERARGIPQPKVPSPSVAKPQSPASAAPKVADGRDPVLEWINDTTKAHEWARVLTDWDGRSLRYVGDVAKLAAVKIRLRQPHGEITQKQVQFEVLELLHRW